MRRDISRRDAGLCTQFRGFNGKAKVAQRFKQTTFLQQPKKTNNRDHLALFTFNHQFMWVGKLKQCTAQNRKHAFFFQS